MCLLVEILDLEDVAPSGEILHTLPFANFLMRYAPSLFRQYHLEREHYGTTGKGHSLRHLNPFA